MIFDFDEQIVDIIAIRDSEDVFVFVNATTKKYLGDIVNKHLCDVSCLNYEHIKQTDAGVLKGATVRYTELFCIQDYRITVALRKTLYHFQDQAPGIITTGILLNMRQSGNALDVLQQERKFWHNFIYQLTPREKEILIVLSSVQASRITQQRKLTMQILNMSEAALNTAIFRISYKLDMSIHDILRKLN